MVLWGGEPHICGIMEEYFQRTLRYFRIQRGFTQEDLAHAANINEKYYGRIERGESSPTIAIFFCICNALDTTPNVFMTIMEKIDEIEKQDT